MRASVLIVDSQPAARQGLRVEIERAPRLRFCGEARDMRDAMKHFDGKPPELVVVEVGLVSGAGVELIKRIRERSPSARILAWSAQEDSAFAERALRAGATGYISKERPVADVVAALCKILDGGVYLSDAVANRLLSLVSRRSAPADTPAECLSDRELQVFRLIGDGRTTSEIAGQLRLSAHTIETYRSRIKGKLGLRSSADLGRAAAQWVLGRDQT